MTSLGSMDLGLMVKYMTSEERNILFIIFGKFDKFIDGWKIKKNRWKNIFKEINLMKKKVKL